MLATHRQGWAGGSSLQDAEIPAARCPFDLPPTAAVLTTLLCPLPPGSPGVQKGNETARTAHIALNCVNILLFAWQVGELAVTGQWPQCCGGVVFRGSGADTASCLIEAPLLGKQTRLQPCPCNEATPTWEKAVCI